MSENEILVTEEVAENTEHTAEETAPKMYSQEEVDAIILACDFGLKEVYKSNNYIYLVNADGTDGAFFGIDGLANVGLTYPYVVGTAHSAETWAQYVALHPYLGLATDLPDGPTEDYMLPTVGLEQITQ